MTVNSALALNRLCYCWPVSRAPIVDTILAQNAAPNMAEMLSVRPHYFANTSIFLAPAVVTQMTDQIRAIEDVIKLPAYVDAVQQRAALPQTNGHQRKTDGVFMGYDFHITEDGPRLIEINSNAGGAFIVDMIEQAIDVSSGEFAKRVLEMFQSEWAKAGNDRRLRSIAIVDTNPLEQFHYPDMCLAKTLLERQGLTVIIADPSAFQLNDGGLYHGDERIDLVYNRLTDFDLSDSPNSTILQAYAETAAVVTPAPHHHALYADKRNLIWLSDPARLAEFGASQAQIKALESIPSTAEVKPGTAEMMWQNRKTLFFKPQAGFGSRGAFRGAKLTKKVWGQILEGGYIAQELVAPPVRAVTVDAENIALKFDVRIYTYDGAPLLLAARIYQGQTTNLRTSGGGLAAVIPVATPPGCGPVC